MSTPHVVWHGSQHESSDLQIAVARHCTCRFNELTGDVVELCPSHRMLEEDQWALDGLLFARRITARLHREEWSHQVRPRRAPARSETMRLCA